MWIMQEGRAPKIGALGNTWSSCRREDLETGNDVQTILIALELAEANRF
jgi:hypothetical protein